MIIYNGLNINFIIKHCAIINAIIDQCAIMNCILIIFYIYHMKKCKLKITEKITEL